eukprot:m.177114 g.177114  ORF g.177114 m.177114 type:complete len:1223 (+) comp25323_c1_seq3:44-3712(+)
MDGQGRTPRRTRRPSIDDEDSISLKPPTPHFSPSPPPSPPPPSRRTTHSKTESVNQKQAIRKPVKTPASASKPLPSKAGLISRGWLKKGKKSQPTSSETKRKAQPAPKNHKKKGKQTKASTTTSGNGWEKDSSTALHVIADYIHETGLESLLTSLFDSLFEKGELPFNPFPLFIQELRKRSMKLEMNAISKEWVHQMLSRFQSEYLDTSNSSVRCAVDDLGQQVWGLPNMLAVTDVYHLRGVGALCEDIVPPMHTPGIACDLCVSVFGPYIYGALFPFAQGFDIRQEYVIRGKDVLAAIDFFADAVYDDCVRIHSSDHNFLALAVSSPNYAHTETPGEDLLDSASETKEAITECVTGAYEIAQGNPPFMTYTVRARAIFRLTFVVGDHVVTQLMQGRVLYLMHFIKKTKRRKTAAPAELATNSARKKSGRKLSAVAKGAEQERASPKVMVVMSGRPFEALYRGVFFDQAQVRTYEALHATAFPDLADDAYPKPDDPNMYQEFHGTARQNIASLNLDLGLIQIVNEALVLLLVEEAEWTEVQALPDIFRLFGSSAAHIMSLAQANWQLQDAISLLGQQQEHAHIIEALLTQYKVHVEKMFEKEADPLITRIKSYFVHFYPTPPPSGIFDKKLNSSLETQRRMLKIMFTSLAKPLLWWCPNVRALIDQCRGELDTKKNTKKLKRDHYRGWFPAKNTHLVEDVVTHGVEGMNNSSLVLDVADCVSRVNAPPAIRKEAVYLQYVTDTGLEQMLHSAILSLLSAPQLIPNPFAAIASEMVLGMLRLECWGEPATIVRDRYLKLAPSPIDPANHAFSVGKGFYGTKGSLLLVQLARLKDVKNLTHGLFNTVLPHKRNYESLILANICGPCVLYGLIPHLLTIECEEHYHIAGDSRDQAFQLFASGLVDHLGTLEKEWGRPNGNLVAGLRIAESRLSVAEVLNNPSEAKAEIYTALQNRQLIAIRVYVKVQWRYITVQKAMLLHYSSASGHQSLKALTKPTDPFTTVYFNLQHMAAAYERCDYAGDNPHSYPATQAEQSLREELIEAKVNGNMWLFHLLLLTRCRVTADLTFVPACVRLFHSVVEQLKYVKTLGTTLQDIIQDHLDLLQATDQKEGLVEVTDFTKMYLVFMDKLQATLEQPTTLCEPSFVSFLIDRLNSHLQVQGKTVMTQMTDATCETLDEISQDLDMIAEGFAKDLFELDSELNNFHKLLLADFKVRSATTSRQSAR